MSVCYICSWSQGERVSLALAKGQQDSAYQHKLNKQNRICELVNLRRANRSIFEQSQASGSPVFSLFAKLD